MRRCLSRPVSSSRRSTVVAMLVAGVLCPQVVGASQEVRQLDSSVGTQQLAGQYVALGDSYSAGEGLTPYKPGTQDRDDGGNRCHRSNHAYPVKVGAALAVEPVFVACSGAEAQHLFDSVQ